MKSIILLPICFALAYGAGHPYSFAYTTVDGQSRSESGAGGAVQGSYSYIDANGDTRRVDYVADEFGYRPSGDISIDRRTAAEALALERLAPKGTAPLAAAPVPIPAPLTAPFATYSAPLAAPFAATYQTALATPLTAPYASPALALKTIAAPSTLALSGPAFSSFSTSISHASPLIARAAIPAPAIAAPLISTPGLLKSFRIESPNLIYQSKI